VIQGRDTSDRDDLSLGLKIHWIDMFLGKMLRDTSFKDNALRQRPDYVRVVASESFTAHGTSQSSDV
jgi:hypothetical protein